MKRFAFKDAGIWLVLLVATILSFQNCGQQAEFVAVDEDGSFQSLKSGPSCFFNGQELPEGATITAFQNSTTSLGACISETRICRDGNLSGSFNYASCQPNANASCLFNGQTIAHGQTITAYLNNGPGQSCTSENRTCTNGILSGSYTYGSCGSNERASCVFNGRVLAHGEEVPAFQASTTADGSACAKEKRVCEDGRLTGSYAYPSCTPGIQASCLFNGQVVASGEVLQAFPKSSVAYGQTCAPEARLCSNGVLSGSASFGSCAIGAPASCTFNGQTIAHGQVVQAFTSSSVAYGQSCSPQARLCNNGALSGSGSFASCNVAAPASCLFNGQNVAHGASVVGYASPTVPAGTTCTPIARSCSNGTLSGSAAYASCTAVGLVSSKVPVTISCSIDAANSQTLVVSLADGTSKSWGFGNQSPGTFTATFDSAPVAFQAYSNSALSAHRYANQTAHTLTFYSEDGRDSDYNDLVCSFSW